jgi:hypothetical protein
MGRGPPVLCNTGVAFRDIKTEIATAGDRRWDRPLASKAYGLAPATDAHLGPGTYTWARKQWNAAHASPAFAERAERTASFADGSALSKCGQLLAGASMPHQSKVGPGSYEVRLLRSYVCLLCGRRVGCVSPFHASRFGPPR